MNDLISTLDELTIKQIDKSYAGDSKLKVLAKSLILNYDDEMKDAIVNKLKAINQDHYEYIQEVFDATIDASFNIIPAKSGLEFWNNQPQMIINGIYYNDINEYKPE